MLARALAIAPLVFQAAHAAGEGPSADDLRALGTDIGSVAQRDDWAGQVDRDQARRLREANRASSADWRRMESLADWVRFRDERMARLQRSLGHWPPPPDRVTLHVTGRQAGEGYTVENVLYESRAGLWVSANRYLPEAPGAAMPGVIVSHSHHTPKEQSELQDLGRTYARAGCVVLVPDHLGHGERRQHPFRGPADYDGEFRAGRQDYWFRYDTSLQLYLADESLMGCLAWDLLRGVDVLLATEGVDETKIALLGAVAGGGDPAAVAAALDGRIAAAAPFNFGGPQPESPFPLPEDAEESFEYAGGGSWESTRNLAGSAAEGFLPWAIVAAVAPRGLVYAHEFAWDRQRDPVWRRLEAVYAWHGAADRLAFTHGRGGLSGEPPEATHCTHIGREHRARIDAALAQWFGVRVAPEQQSDDDLPRESLACWTPEWTERLQPKSLRAWLSERLDAELASLRERDADERRMAWQQRFAAAGGTAEVRVVGETAVDEALLGASVERVVLETEPGIVVPLLLLAPRDAARSGVVVAVSQGGKAAIVQQRAEDVARLLAGGVAVVLPDLRGTGETSAEDGRDRTGGDASRAATELMLGRPMLEARLADLRGVLQFVRSRDELSNLPLALWGDSPVEPRAADEPWIVPHGVDVEPRGPEPGGPLLALLAAATDEHIRGVVATRLVAELRGALDGPRVLLPHDAIVPGWLALGDVPELIAALAPRPVHLAASVDAQNRPLSGDQLGESLTSAREAYAGARAAERLTFDEGPSASESLLRMLDP
jgi:dienelactone hydrolase